MTKSFLFSVITVTLNNHDGLQKTYESLHNQNCKNYEWIVLDGNSNDETQGFLKTTTAKWISEDDHGIYDAMNKGIERATGEFLIFMNAGDCFASPDTLESIEKHLKQHPNTSFIYGDALENIHNTVVYKRSRPCSKIKENMFTHHQAMLYRKERLQNIRYDLSYKIAADYDFTLRFLAQKTLQPLYIAQPICLFESGGLSQQQAVKGRKEQFLIRRQAGGNLIKNIMIFTAQSALYGLRQIAPKLYWFLKRR